MRHSRPVAWTIAGSDSGGGAGIQADLKTMNALGVHGCSAITAMTAQNPRQVSAVQLSTIDFIESQMQTLREELSPVAIKTGMLGSSPVTKAVSAFLLRTDAALVCDPVLIATSGARLGDDDTASAMRALFARAEIVTPNMPEAAAITQGNPARFLEWGAKSVLLKGGHASDDFARDYWSDGEKEVLIVSPRQYLVETHGTGCTLASAIASGIALGMDTLSAVVMAKTYLNRALRLSYRANNTSALFHDTWPSELTPRDLPWLGDESEFAFAKCGDLGFYPIVERSKWIAPLAEVGVKTVQLRIKDLDGEKLDDEIREAVRVSRRYDLKLFINDFWEHALRHEAYGVHLGQEDLKEADWRKLLRAGIRLGISTHSFAELARARSVRPSYVALGPVFPTKIKVMRFAPQGLRTLELWKKLVDVPVVAIGGITLDSVKTVKDAGADGVAVITDLFAASDPVARAKAFVEKLSRSSGN